jgi:cob(I)alamin adenosyltransferase
MTTEANGRHIERMARKKALIDEHIARANRERGVLLVHTGNGKGKSTAAFGMIARALGNGMKVGVVQFVKGAMSTGEEAFFRRFAELEFHVTGAGYTWETQNREGDIRVAREGWEIARKLLADPAFHLVVLDELNIELKEGHLPVEEVLDVLSKRPPMQHVVITGRGAPPELVEAADTVSEMREIKHAYQAGIKAQKGIEW